MLTSCGALGCVWAAGARISSSTRRTRPSETESESLGLSVLAPERLMAADMLSAGADAALSAGGMRTTTGLGACAACCASATCTRLLSEQALCIECKSAYSLFMIQAKEITQLAERCCKHLHAGRQAVPAS